MPPGSLVPSGCPFDLAGFPQGPYSYMYAMANIRGLRFESCATYTDDGLYLAHTTGHPFGHLFLNVVVDGRVREFANDMTACVPIDSVEALPENQQLARVRWDRNDVVAVGSTVVIASTVPVGRCVTRYETKFDGGSHKFL